MNKETNIQTALAKIIEFSESLISSEELSNKNLTYATDIKSNALELKSLICEMINCHNNQIEENIVSSRKVLLVEDNLMNQQVMELIFEDLDIEHGVASDGQEAVDLYKTNHDDFDLILMDINMPVMNGTEAFFNIRIYEEENNLPKTPIIALTANAIKGDRERFLALGMDGYISKPINTNELKSIFDTFIGSKPQKESTSKITKENITVDSSIKIDPSKVAQKLGLNENIANLIINKFKNEINKDLDELSSFVRVNDVENIYQKAHYIKNSCLNMALDEVCEILQKLEDRSLDIEEKRVLLKELLNLINRII